MVQGLGWGFVMIFDPDDPLVREHYRQCGYVIPPCFMCGKQVERGLLQFRAGGTLMLHFECARYLIGRLEVDLERPKRLPEMLVALADPIVKLPREKGEA